MSICHIEFLSDDNITTKLNELVSRANYHIMICNPWLEKENHVVEKLILALKNGIKVEIITLPPSKDKYKRALNEIRNKGGEIFQKENLHAKIFFFDHRDLIVSSTNLKATSLVRNNEAAIYTTDENALKSAKEYFDILKESSEKIVTEEEIVSEEKEPIIEKSGFCIECGEKLEYNKKRPVCKKCYSRTPYYYKWRKYCHECGKKERINIPKPLCDLCYNQSI